MIRFALLMFCIIATDCLFAQKADSAFHNYWFDSRLNYFKQLPAKKKAVIFFGDSITQYGDLAELTGSKNVLNRGIAGDISYGLLYRVDEVIRHRPSKLFILIGTNDLSRGIAQSSIVHNYRQLILYIQKHSPRTQVYVHTVMPINDSLINRQYYKGTNQEIVQLNDALKKMTENLHVVYIDIYNELADQNHQLAAEYTYDGLHLSGMGYIHWINYLKKKKYLNR